MNIAHRLILALLVVAPLVGCDGHGHAHDTHRADAHEHHLESLTAWGEELEAYVQYQPPVAGKPQHWYAQLTWLESHTPVPTGTLVLRFDSEEAGVSEHRLEAAAHENTFKAEVVLPREGKYRLTLLHTLDEAVRTFELGTVSVFGVSSKHDHDHDDKDLIFFPKAQQWRMPFATAAVRTQLIAPQLTAPARLEPVPERHARVVMPAAGVVTTVENGSWPRPGTSVSAGEVLARIVSIAGAGDVSQLRLETVQARERLQLAERELERVRALHEQGWCPRGGYRKRGPNTLWLGRRLSARRLGWRGLRAAPAPVAMRWICGPR
ncbi:hypothetical protein [Alkalilimnicola ehrlichii]|uniref:hypothetical protein n=1 Tax=Alkalilimnicola ehrlichii TaxID=351052 RepID=UPI0011C029F1|nr:hypothetical protein [Alkalilimnicola ehrlichii]